MKKIICSSLIASMLFGASIDIKEAPQVKRNEIDTQNSILSYNKAIKDIKNSVVNISISKAIDTNMGNFDDFFNDPFFDQHFKRFFGDGFGRMKPDKNNKQIIKSLGSGVIISSDGYIITNNHVVENSESIIVSLINDQTEYKAKVIGTDPKTDLAVIKIEAKDLKAANFANSDDILEGDVVFALGNPFGVGLSVTSGIISALNKNNIGLNQYENFIQTDASINPGNSGGALVDSRGALIGINTAIVSRSGGNNGIGFAIPSNMVKDIAKILIEKGKIERGFLGVTITDLQKDVKKAYKNKDGALVTSIEKNSAAEQAGLKRGDLIIKANDKNIKNSSDLKNYIGTLEPNKDIKLVFERDKEVKEIKIKLKSDSQITNINNIIEGLILKELDPRTKANINGILVNSVKEKSKAFECGFRSGDIIIGVEQEEISNTHQFNQAIKKHSSKDLIKIWILRDGYTQLVILK